MTAFSKHLDTLGTIDAETSTAPKSLILDWSSTDGAAWIEPPSGQMLEVARMIVHVGDVGAMDADNYGSTANALANGLSLIIERDGVTLSDLTDYHKITKNSDWSHFSYDVSLDDFGTGVNFLKSRWTFTRFGQPILLRDSRKDKLKMILRDDFTFLTEHHFVVQGQLLGTDRP